MKHQRRHARGLVLQALYEIDSVGHPADEVVSRYLDKHEVLRGDTGEFFRALVLNTLKSKSILDGLIARCAPDWPVDELAIIDRTILRIALWEIAESANTPLKVAINEAVELAKRFGSDSAPRFVNGVLGAVVSFQDEIRRELSLAGQ
ncbi:MAG: transcription antitermination factor NusB [Chloroflexi bacterium]|nr:transcription antitermination factor NusB [Chloroflexota bacterium]